MVVFYKLLKESKESREQKMRTGSVAYADEKIKEAQERAANRAASGKQPVILYFYDGLDILVRPLGDLDHCLVAYKHFRWDRNRSLMVDAICAKEIGKPCELCEAAKEDKDLTAQEYWYLPVWMYQAVKNKDSKTGLNLDAPQAVTFKDENDQIKKACGIRVLELSQYGAIGSVLTYIRKFMSDPTNGSFMDRDFLVSLEGKGKGNKRFIIDKKDPRPMDPRLAKNIPSLDRVSEKILESLPPQVAVSASAVAEQVFNQTGNTTDTENEYEHPF